MTASTTEKRVLSSECRVPSTEYSALSTQHSAPGVITTSIIRLDSTSEDHHIARMAALALGLSVLEAAIPSPLPGVKAGLANIVILIVLARYGWRTAAWVSLLPR